MISITISADRPDDTTTDTVSVCRGDNAYSKDSSLYGYMDVFLAAVSALGFNDDVIYKVIGELAECEHCEDMKSFIIENL